MHALIEPTRQQKSIWSRLENGLLNLLAVGGLACIALVIAAFFFNISLILFKTGSMAPTIPQGSMSVVQRISADDIEVGDVVTVDREAGELPVTHRVIAVHPQRPGEALIEMQGDANPNPDPGPYRVTEVRKVLWSVPGAASVIVWFSDPLILAGLTLGAALLVLWAFWPRKGEFESASTAPIDLKDQQ
ncbi:MULTISPECIES: signal peptidase I [unclassified Rhodococcus (in: high G+C Gram-positive bacteria)]|uniref:signal peptidase I n=1 Tax=unclassified Rhodococcus (in: high G+C Gram-positive bacteria) TaxID=192944 RepID=UPI000B701171|nr:MULTISPECIES: signal peptidase I [unclassified Rhodococcus (in: high G+C Gram-positive bacteria)]OWY79540.1 signal peptidase I [Rhodococcus sp. BUPNP1]WSE21740.1 signal peptidase I [Rhodococcus sp. PD04]